MRLHRFYIGGKNGINLAKLGVSSRFTLDSLQNEDFSPLIHQWRDVFRYMPGSRLTLFDDSKTECLCMIESFTGSAKVELVILEKADTNKTETSNSDDDEVQSVKKDELWLFASILKNENFDLVVQKVTELGIDHIVPLVCDRTIKKNVNMKRAQKIIVEASEQSGRISIPTIYEPMALKKAVEEFLASGGEAVVCHQNGDQWSKAKELLKKYPLGFIIGPEGGWSEKEENYFNKMSLRKVKFSENVLRAETAAIGVVTLVLVE